MCQKGDTFLIKYGLLEVERYGVSGKNGKERGTGTLLVLGTESSLTCFLL